ncbi:hypothetical protein GCM10023238_24660 [Streptomyces heliomycini]
MGSADIYEAVERLPEIRESLVIGVEQPDGGYWMPLFVHLAPGSALDEDLRGRIKQTIREHLSPRHVPDEIIEVPGVPHTLTGKRIEVPVSVSSRAPRWRKRSTGIHRQPRPARLLRGTRPQARLIHPAGKSRLPRRSTRPGTVVSAADYCE